MRVVIYDPIYFSQVELWPLEFAVQIVSANGVQEKRPSFSLFDDQLTIEELQELHHNRLWNLLEHAILAGVLSTTTGPSLRAKMSGKVEALTRDGNKETLKFKLNDCQYQILDVFDDPDSRPMVKPEELRCLDTDGNDRYVFRNMYCKWVRGIGYHVPEDLRPDKEPKESQMVTSTTDKSRKIMVVHGRNERIRNSMFQFLRALGLSPIEWSSAIEATGQGTPYIADILDKAFEMAQAVLVLFTGDDWAKLHDSFQVDGDPAYETTLTLQPRQNVLFEAGMAFGCNRKRTIFVEVGKVRPFSDLTGLHMMRFDGSDKTRHELSARLKAAECNVDTSGVDWLRAGEFDNPVPADEPSVLPETLTAVDENLTSEEIEILTTICSCQGKSTAHLIGLRCGLPAQRAILLANGLVKRSFLESYTTVNQNIVYLLKDEGREVLEKLGLLK